MAAWLTTLSRNHIAKTLRKAHRSLTYQSWQSVDAYLRARFQRLATDPLPQEALGSRETQDLVRMTLASIPGNYHTILLMY